jgi:two-component system, chemotaxis family, sensor kinase CheA
VRNLRRSVHTLKGDSAACGFSALSDLAHAVEDVLTPEVAARDAVAFTELVLVAADCFDNLLSAYRNNVTPPSTEAAHKLIEALRNPKPAEPAFAPKFDWSEYERLVIAKGSVAGRQVYNIGLAIDPDCPMRAAAAQLVRNVLQGLGTVLVMRPDESTPVPDVIEAALCTAHPLEVVQRKASIPTVVSNIVAEPLAGSSGLAAVAKPLSAEPVVTQPATAAQPAARVAPAAPPAAPVERPATLSDEPVATAVPAEAVAQPVVDMGVDGEAHRSAAAENVIRVDAGRIDAVLDLVGELIIARSMMQQLLAEIPQNNSLRARTSDALQLQGQILNKLQRSVMKIRMVPVERLFRRLPRIVRDTAKQLGREVTLDVQGENTDLDKSILDALGEPMMHIVRNSVDHGIEPPAERLASGKPAEGTIRLNAYHQGNQVVIEIADDGRGIDLEKLVKKAVDRGIITNDEAQRLTEKEATDLIFHAGLSTASKVTQVSGRGVGMDIVRSVLDRLKGTVSVRTIAGEGTTFKLIMPLTLAIIKALLFRISGRLYAVPLGNVLEIVRAWEKDLHVIDGQEVMRIREEVVPLIHLSRMHTEAYSRPSKWFVIIVTLGDRKAGLVVDHLIGEQELVIKALDESLVSSELVSGASILGDGRVVPILSISNVVEKLGRGFSRRSAETVGMGVR